MKKLKSLRKKKATAEEHAHHRITNETVAEHRERVLAGGRRFKYPVQYVRHRLVINALIIGVVALIALVGVIWWQLYPAQNTSTFFYRITRVVPLPVAKIDGYPVRYSDYLVGFRAQEHYLQHKEGVDLYAENYASQLNYVKRQAMDDAITDAYAEKIAKENNITVSEEKVDEAIEKQRESRDGATSKETYDAIVLDHFNWTPAEARDVTRSRLLRQEVAYFVDKIAKEQRDRIERTLKTEDDFGKIASSIGGEGDTKISTGKTPLVPIDNQDGGMAYEASKLAVGQISSPFRSAAGDGYYIVKLIEKDDEGKKISYEYIKIPLTQFKKQLEKLKKDGRVTELINIPKTSTPAVKP